MKTTKAATATHVVIWLGDEGVYIPRPILTVPYSITARTPRSITITDEGGREIKFTARRSGRWVRVHQEDAWDSQKVDEFLVDDDQE